MHLFIFLMIPFIKLQNNTVKQKNDEKWDGELSHLSVFWLSYAAFVSSALKTEDILLFVFYAFGSCFRTLQVILVSNFWYSTKLHGSCHMKLLPSWHMFCVHHTTMHQFKVLFKPKAEHTFTWYFVTIWMDGAETTPLKLVQEFIFKKRRHYLKVKVQGF